jgi:hypothetical protein
MNPYTNLYVNQAGSGIAGFSGVRYQRGHGFFGRLFSSAILPALKFLGRHALSTGINVAEDFVDGRNLKESAQARFKEGSKVLARDVIERARQAQLGSGVKRNLILAAELEKPRKRRKRQRKVNKKAKSILKAKKLIRKKKRKVNKKTKPANFLK